MIWKNSKDMTSELFLILGLVIILIGFISLMKFYPWETIVSGIVVLIIGMWRIIKLKQIGKNIK